MNEVNTTEDRLRSEISELKRQLEEQKKSGHHGGHQNRRPSTVTLVLIALLLAVLIVVGFFVGYLPRQRREEVLAAESRETGITLPIVNVSRVTRSESNSFLVLPGNIQAVTEAPILARATGYTKVMNFASNLSSLAFFLLGGKVYFAAGLVMGIGQLTGARIGAKMVIAKGTKFIRPIFIAVVLALTIKLAYDAYAR